ncbi:MAG: hypothetical protein IPK65_05210 [Gammaproteobacteria bacterium]|nr:hypothetical protein [Gammaproteobacteria bacterium]
MREEANLAGTVLRMVVAVLFGLCAGPLAAEQGEVTGAFGFEFGQVIDPAGLKALDGDEDAGLSYAVTPDNAYGPLDEYAITLTPAGHRVYRITARGSFSSMQRCRDELVKLERALERKYVKTSGSKSFGFDDIPVITFGQSPRKIRGKCTGRILHKTLTLSYIDEDLEQAARDEANPAGIPAQDAGAPRDESGL